MKPRAQTLVTFSFSLAALAAAGLLISRWSEHRTLAGELAALPPAVQHAGAGAGSSIVFQAPPGGGLNLLLRPFAEKSGDDARRELVRRLKMDPPPSEGSWEKLKRIAPLLESLSVGELLAVIGTEPAARFMLAAGEDEKLPASEIDGHLARLAAWRRLGVLAPEEALAVCAKSAPPKPPDTLLIQAAWAMREWAGKNPAAAIRWGKHNISWLPATWPGWVLTEVARTEGVSSAGSLARQEGVLLAESMRWCATGSLADIDSLMTEVDKERSASPERFTDSPLVRQNYRAVTEKICNSLGFEEGRKFAEKWTAGLPWQEDSAFTAFSSTLNPNSLSESPAAADWVVDFLPEDRRAAAAEKMLSSWTGFDSEAPLQWLAKHADSPWRDPALAAFCRSSFSYAPERAVAWAAAIGDEALRAETLAACGK